MRFDVRFNLLSKQIPVYFDEIKIVTIKGDAEFYEGEYEATPKVEKIVIETAQKTMKSDFTINAIPYAEVTNTANGLTVTIAE